MQAIILAAGMGKRLGDLTKDNTKCMVKVGGVTLIERLLRQLEQYNINRVVMVVGYQAAHLRNYLSTLSVSLPIEFVENNVYDKTNNIYSLYLAKDYLQEDDTLLFESDIIVEDSIIGKLINHPHDSLALVDKFESWMDGTVVTLDEENRIQRFIPTDQFRYAEIPTYYKTVNIYKFGKTFSRQRYVPFLEAYCKALGNNEYYEQVLRVITMLDNADMRALPLHGEYWYEIDDIQDLDIAESMFCDAPYERLCSRYGGYWRYPHMTDFCYLVNPYFPNQRLRDELAANFDNLLTQYPSGARVNNLLAAKWFNIKQDHIAIGNGAAELIKALTELLTGKTGIIRPTFEEYPNRLIPDDTVVYETTAPDFKYNADELMSFFEDKDIQNLIVINADNPTGNYIPQPDILRLATWCQTRDIRLIVDESFADFATERQTLIQDALLEGYPKMVVLKSISKSYGVPGLRLGILATADTRLMLQLRQAMPIWNINSFAEFYLQIMGKYERAYRQALDLFLTERKRFGEALSSIRWLRVIPSEANYFLCEVKSPYTPIALTHKLLQDYNILIKDCTKKCGGNYIRIAIRNKEDNDRLLHALNNL